MPRNQHYIIASLLAIVFILLSLTSPMPAQAEPIDDTRKQLLENQRNIIHLSKEKQLFQKELGQAIKQRKGNNNQPMLQAEINDIRDSINVADVLIPNISELVTRQQLLLSTLERGTPLTALDIALNKVLNSNLPELAKTLANNPAARKEVARLRTLLKEQARLGIKTSSASNFVSHTTEHVLAENEFLRLLSRFSSNIDDNAEDKMIKITGIANNIPLTEDEILSYLGHDQYHMETTVYAGKMTFIVDGRPWQLHVTQEEDQATYMMIYDISDQNQPRLVMFNKSLLLE